MPLFNSRFLSFILDWAFLRETPSPSSRTRLSKIDLHSNPQIGTRDLTEYRLAAVLHTKHHPNRPLGCFCSLTCSSSCIRFISNIRYEFCGTVNEESLQLRITRSTICRTSVTLEPTQRIRELVNDGLLLDVEDQLAPLGLLVLENHFG